MQHSKIHIAHYSTISELLFTPAVLQIWTMSTSRGSVHLFFRFQSGLFYSHGVCLVSWDHLSFYFFLCSLWDKLGALMINLGDYCFLCLGECCDIIVLTAKLSLDWVAGCLFETQEDRKDQPSVPGLLMNGLRLRQTFGGEKSEKLSLLLSTSITHLLPCFTRFLCPHIVCKTCTNKTHWQGQTDLFGYALSYVRGLFNVGHQS